MADRTCMCDNRLLICLNLCVRPSLCVCLGDCPGARLEVIAARRELDGRRVGSQAADVALHRQLVVHVV